MLVRLYNTLYIPSTKCLVLSVLVHLYSTYQPIFSLLNTLVHLYSKVPPNLMIFFAQYVGTFVQLSSIGLFLELHLKTLEQKFVFAETTLMLIAFLVNFNPPVH